jgi:NADH-quinone oxidoreductase subunit M
VIFFAGLGLPGLCGFIGEIFVVLSTWNYSPLLAIIAASGVILTAAYILWTIQRVYLGPEYKGPHPEALSEMNEREWSVAAILSAFAIVMGVFPNTMFHMMKESTAALTTSLAEGYKIQHTPPADTASVTPP